MLGRITRRAEETEPERTQPVKVDPYSAWRDAATLSADALRHWSRAAPSNRAVAHAVYRAALDVEDAAAVALARWRQGAG
jgi:hypothetical protein